MRLPIATALGFLKRATSISINALAGDEREIIVLTHGTNDPPKTYSRQRNLSAPVAMARNTQRLPDHTCPFCGTDYSVDAHANGRPAYHTAICSACGDVMAEWHGKGRYYRRKRSRPNPKRRAATIVAIAAETAKPEPARSRRGAVHKATRARRSGHEGSRKSRRA